ncbi:MAG: hypothetical protein EBW86_01555 [Rhodobacteraceae bacterium]|nr:hypothetical protein [Paracoccaceae bacterium]
MPDVTSGYDILTIDDIPFERIGELPSPIQANTIAAGVSPPIQDDSHYSFGYRVASANGRLAVHALKTTESNMYSGTSRLYFYDYNLNQIGSVPEVDFDVTVDQINDYTLSSHDMKISDDGRYVAITLGNEGNFVTPTDENVWVFDLNNFIDGDTTNYDSLLINEPTPLDPDGYSGWGSSIAISNDYIVVGSPNYSVDGVNHRGRVDIFYTSNGDHYGSVYSPETRAGEDERFGIGLAIDGNTLYIGADSHAFRGQVFSNSYSGAIHTFDISNNEITHTFNQQYIIDSLFNGSESSVTEDFKTYALGESLAISNNYLYIGHNRKPKRRSPIEFEYYPDG